MIAELQAERFADELSSIHDYCTIRADTTQVSYLCLHTDRCCARSKATASSMPSHQQKDSDVSHDQHHDPAMTTTHLQPIKRLIPTTSTPLSQSTSSANSRHPGPMHFESSVTLIAGPVPTSHHNHQSP